MLAHDFSVGCLVFVRGYREGQKTKAEAIRGLMWAADAVQDQFRDEAELTGTLSTYFRMLDDFDREKAAALQGGLRPDQDPGRDQNDEEPEDQVGPPAIRGRDEDADINGPRKRRNIDNLMRFSVGPDLSLPAELRETLEAVKDFAKDPAHAKARILSCQTRPDFPSALWGDVISNSFIDLDKVIDFHYATGGAAKRTVHQFGDLQLVSDTTKTDRHVRTSGDWGIAWGRYRAAVQFVFPHREQELAAYGRHIEDTFLANPSRTNRVLQYDK